MNEGNRKLMDSSKPGRFYLRSTSAVSLHERFSQVVADQLTRSRMRTFDPVLLHQRRRHGLPKVVLLVRRGRSSLLHLQTRDSSVGVRQHLRRGSVWTRLGWQRGTRRLPASRPRGFWSFMNKYRRRRSSTPTYRGQGNLHSRLGQRLLRTRNIQKLTTGRTHLQRGGATAYRRKEHVPTKKQLDAQLDEYMSMSRSRLDKELDDYMAMAGETHWE
ncbi:uncharacterized protein LOC119496420 isoform X1 [Sebastes umbrosus]|uniref:uncharacterized protein LOC119496420 isoform X1 n=1 Tax=Sebastes umbrosus TaxID=72105 RepID=UPI00189E6B6E|nr:uncharacterized protein LOC119496420 isoform X1 [Sebastes umbrosus]XP_037639635.1 uncharacterized protein LOC119496420 isoform X1 [Sebastes umbrosus]XP_037639636.1 uncharacterized protein LOC119496420 isoform X1 [Sebastes umbrosus]XP_037639637.1 uncharacterized protein LOC119496420 isoform X1 [Sebastes umbrosus]